MSISTVPALPAHAATMDRNLVNVADMQTLAIPAPQTPGPADGGPDWGQYSPGKDV